MLHRRRTDSPRRRTLSRNKLAGANRRLAFESLEHRQLLAATPISVQVAGSTGSEVFQLQIDGIAVATFTNTRVLTAARTFDAFNYTHPTDVSIDRVRVALVNDGAGGVDRNLYVDGVTLAGVKFESEASSVYSTGTWDAATNGRLPGFRQSEALHYNGYLQFGAVGSVIQVRAAGRTGQEQMQLQIGGQVVATFSNVGGNYTTGQFVTFTYNATTAIGLGQIRVAYTNDGTSTTGLDKNLRVDAVILDGLRNETEAPTVYSTGTFIAGVGRASGYQQTEYLHLNGYFEYASTVAAGSIIEIRAAGRTGQEQMTLEIAGQVVATYSNVGGDYGAGQYQTFVYRHTGTVTIGQIRINYTNDGNTSAGVDKNLRVDGLTLDGVVHHAEASNVFTTGTYVEGVGRMPGLWQSEYLHANGYLQFGSTAVPGILALGTSLISVNESAGTASIPVVRTGGSDGTVGLRYTTVNATAIAGSDYTANTGLIVFGPGETTKYIVVSIAGDTLDEPNEAFTLASDLAIGGATLNQPRTATITIVDDDGAPPIGTGNGLLGAYYNDQGLTEFVFERTDPTVNFTWGQGSPSAFIGADTFSTTWRGKIEPLYSETYTFRTTSDDGVRLWVNHQLIVDQWNNHGATEHTGTITLVAGQKYEIFLGHYDGTGDSIIKLEWSSASQPRQVVPQSQLYSDPPLPTEVGNWGSQTIVSGLIAPTAMDFDSSGRIFISEQQGVVRVYQNGQLLPAPFIDIRHQVNNIQDRGMLGIAVHPNFPQTPYVYVSYTYDPAETLTRTGNAGPDGGGNRVARVTRFTANPATGFNTAIPASEVVIVGSNSTWANISSPHLDSTDDMSLPPSGGNNGEMRDILIADSRSHTVGNLAFGPDGMLYVGNGDGTSYGRVDWRTSRVQSINSLSGKLLRVDPITGKGLADNPFYNGDPDSNRSKVYNYGLRNPFRYAFHPETGVPYIGDVGWQVWEEINVGVGENFGWPWYEGGDGTNLQTGGYRDLPAAQTFYASNPDVTALFWSRTHSNGGVAIVAGDFYTGTVYPPSYRNTLFLSDIGDNQVRVLRLNSDGSPHSVTPLNVNVGVAVEMSMGRNGFLYFVDIANGRVGRFTFTPASAVMAEAPADFDGDGLTTGHDFLAWQRGLGITTDASMSNGDADGDGQVTASDLAVWQNAFAGGDDQASGGSSALAAEAYWLAFDRSEKSDSEELELPEPIVAPSSSSTTGRSHLALSASLTFNATPTAVSEDSTDAAFDWLDEENPFAWSPSL